MRKSPRAKIWIFTSLLLGGLGGLPPALAQEGPPPGGTAGIRVTVVDARPELLEADLDLTAYTRTGGYTYVLAGAPPFNIAALDYGDGTTLPTTTLGLVSPGGGPGGSSVFRSLASFTHVYPALGAYTVRTGMFCYYCYRGAYTVFPAGAPTSPTYSTSFDYVPTNVIGNLAATYIYAGTTPAPDPTYSIRYRLTYYGAITNTAEVVLRFAVQEIPTASTWGLILLGVALAGGGLFVLRRF